MKQLFLILALVMKLCAYSQDDKTVTLVVSGQGKTKDEANHNALRSAIEQAFGAFISSKTEILNDNLVRDEIVSVTNGNIQKYEILNEVLLPNNLFATTLKATVSIGKLTTFCQSKGINSEFKGGLFAMNIAMQELNEQNEKKGLDNFYQVFIDILPKCLDYSIVPSDPINENNKWKVQLNANFIFNDNYDVLANYIFQFVTSISMSKSEVNSYKTLNKPVYPLKIDRKKYYKGNQAQLIIDTFYFRNESTYNTIISYPYTILKYIVTKFKYDNSLHTIDINAFIHNTNNWMGFTADPTCIINLKSTIPFYRFMSRYELERVTGIFHYVRIHHGYFPEDAQDSKICIADGWFNGPTLSIFNIPDAESSSKIYETYFNADWFKLDVRDKVTMRHNPILNLFGHNYNKFLEISLSEYLNIEEIKKITEYKIILD